MELQHWHTKDWREVLTELSSEEHGLSQTEAKRRLERDGLNKLAEAHPPSLFFLFVSQFKSPLIFILALAGFVLLLLHETIDSLIIFFVLFFNAVVGMVQEGRAQRTLLAIKRFSETTTTVFRDGKEIVISDVFIAEGDVVILQEGEKVPADGRIIASHSLVLDESALTGESTPVAKTEERIHRMDSPVSDRHNMAFKGTNVASGNGKMVVVATGAKTFLGRISETISTFETEIPLRADIRNLSRLIIIAVILVSALLFSLGFFYGRPVIEIFKTVVALSVSIIPEGLPIVVTLVLAAGVWRMSKRNVLVKKLQAVEALGQARVIAVDKTGTITKNELVVEKAYVGGKEYQIRGVGYEPKGELLLEGEVIEPLNHSDLVVSAKISSLLPNARLSYVENEKTWKISGDPTEAAMLVFAEKVGFHREILEEESPRISEIPFDYKEKYHVAVCKERGRANMLVAGAPETLLSKITHILKQGRSEKIETRDKEGLESMFLKFSGNGLRVIALAYRQGIGSSAPTREDVGNLTFVGFLGMKDAARSEVRDAVLRAQSAGMKVVMITGDHKDAARSIAKDAGIYKTGDHVLTGENIDALNEAELAGKVEDVSVFARVTPEHKLKIIQAYKRRGEIIAMTGDGGNDAPSLVAADLGLAMGKIGTEVAKEASDIVIMDDDFSSIVAGIEEGRNMYKTIKKVILYLFSTSVGEVLVIVGALGMGWPLPVLAAQIIWLNLVTDGFLDVSLAMDPKEPGLLSGTFKRPDKYLIDALMLKRMAVMAFPMMLGTLILFWLYLVQEGLPKALTVSLTTLAVFQWFNAWNCRSESGSIFKKGIFSNKFLVGATFIVVLLQILAVYAPFFQKILKTVPLGGWDLLIIVLVASSIVLFEEIRKFFYRRTNIGSVLSPN